MKRLVVIAALLGLAGCKYLLAPLLWGHLELGELDAGADVDAGVSDPCATRPAGERP